MDYMYPDLAKTLDHSLLHHALTAVEVIITAKRTAM